MSLSELAYKARIAIKVGGVFFLAIILIYASIVVVLMNIKKPAPEVVSQNLNIAFGQIPRVSIEEAREGGSYRFVLHTIDGELPQATTEAHVYYVPNPDVTLSYIKQADAIAQEFNFDTQTLRPQRVDEGSVRYEDDTKVLLVDIRNFNYTFTFKPSTLLQGLVEATPSADIDTIKDSLVNRARTPFLSIEGGGAALAGGSFNMVYLTYNLAEGEFVPTQDNEQPQAVRVDFFKPDESLKLVTPSFFTSQNYAILAPLTDDAQVVAAQLRTYEKLIDGAGMYPLISVQEAWKGLEEGNVKIVSVADKADSAIKIQDIYVAYYDPESYQQYIQPVYVFLGSDNFVGYLPAIPSEYAL